MAERYRITQSSELGQEQTWVLLPDLPSAKIQAEEFANREKTLHIRVYREIIGAAGGRELVLDLPPKRPRTAG